MKRKIAFFLCGMLIVSVACIVWNLNREPAPPRPTTSAAEVLGLDYRSIQDTATGHFLTLGDTKSAVDDKLGGIVLQSANDENRYLYCENALWVVYVNGRASSFESTAKTSRFLMLGFDYTMTEADVAAAFPDVKDFGSGDDATQPYKVYSRYYDESGNVVTENDSFHYAADVYYTDNGYDGFSLYLANG